MDITNEREVKGTGIERNEQGTYIKSKRNVQGTDTQNQFTVHV